MILARETKVQVSVLLSSATHVFMISYKWSNLTSVLHFSLHCDADRHLVTVVLGVEEMVRLHNLPNRLVLPWMTALFQHAACTHINQSYLQLDIACSGKFRKNVVSWKYLGQKTQAKISHLRMTSIFAYLFKCCANIALWYLKVCLHLVLLFFQCKLQNVCLSWNSELCY